MAAKLSLTSPFGLIVLVVVGAALGKAAAAYAPYELVAAGSKSLAVFIGAVWVTVMAFALKVADVTEAPALTSSEHQRLELRARSAVRRIWFFAAANALSGLLILAPSAIGDAKLHAPAWLIVLAGAAFGFSVYSVIAHAVWQEELRQYRSGLRERERRQNEYAELLRGNEDPAIDESVRDQIRSLNRSVDWAGDRGGDRIRH